VKVMNKITLAHLPTPLHHFPALDRLLGCEVWLKRDDMSSGAAAGNKIRKLEYLLADALGRGAKTLITCGALQSNHARATALCAAEHGLSSLLFLRTRQPAPDVKTANLLLDALAGAEIRTITPLEYRRRGELMAEAAREIEGHGGSAYVIPEGGSNGVGAFGYVDAMAEVEQQVRAGEGGGTDAYDAVVHACGSGGTAAGIALGLARHPLARTVLAVAVCDDRAYFQATIQRITREALVLDASLATPVPVTIEDRFKGPGYGVSSDEQLDFIVRVAGVTGLVLDPVYTGKALFALSRLTPRPRRVLFLHSGGLPGLLAEADALAPALLRRRVTVA
jgi:D-cysteine desulfhydrase